MKQNLLSNLRKTISQGEITATKLPLCPDISLFLISGDYPTGRLDYDEMMSIINTPAYWAFCWASGQVLSRYILDHPEEVKGRCILDFGTGSGVVAIAAKLAGANRVIACDIDQQALQATQANARLNNVEIETLGDIDLLDTQVDMIIAADVLYDRDNFPWIDRLTCLATDMLIADSRIKANTLTGYQVIAELNATTIPDLDELKEFNQVRIYRRDPEAHLPAP